MDARGYITVDDTSRPTCPGIWALGDCNGRGAFTHTAYNDYEIVAANLLDGGNRDASATASRATRSTSIRRSAASGMTEAEARASGPAAPGLASGR